MFVLMKDERGGRIMGEFVELQPKAYSYALGGDSGDKKA